MLALTPKAAQAVEAIVTQPEAPDGAVLRITSAQSAEGGSEDRDLQLSVVEEPEEDDIRMQGIALSVEPETVGFLDDKVLDAEFAEGGVKFSLYLQPIEPSEDGAGPAAPA